MAKTVAMYWGDVREIRRTELMKNAETEFRSGRYKEALELGKRALKYKSRHKKSTNLNHWYSGLKARITSEKARLAAENKTKNQESPPESVQG
ncbi:hypothetical protein [Burkholderia gladioli]|uniref:hypothetical protein n=1 Tax=Burkholderia gladioli TaxID=28095 RepID=UPI0011D24679|nr:hypothetical protein [Burkholderia gladioli]